MTSETAQNPDSPGNPPGGALSGGTASEGADPISTPGGPVSSVWKWVVAAVIVALLAYPIVRRLGDNGTAASGASPDSADAQLSRSVAAYQAGQYAEAVTAAQAALKLKPDYALAYNNLAVSYLQLHQYAEALQAIQQALRIQPDMELAKNNLAWIQREQAKSTAPPPAPLKPGTVDYYLQQSVDLYQAEKFQQAIDSAEQAIKLDPKMAGAYNNICISYIRLGTFDKAIQNCEKALEIQPDYQLARNNLNWALNSKADAMAHKK